MFLPVRPSSTSRGPRGVQRDLQELHGDLLEPSSGWRRLRRLQLHHREERHQQRPVDACHLVLHQDLLQGGHISAERLRKTEFNKRKCRKFVGSRVKLFNILHPEGFAEKTQLKSVSKFKRCYAIQKILNEKAVCFSVALGLHHSSFYCICFHMKIQKRKQYNIYTWNIYIIYKWWVRNDKMKKTCCMLSDHKQSYKN